jgi:hypothetical protein
MRHGHHRTAPRAALSFEKFLRIVMAAARNLIATLLLFACVEGADAQSSEPDQKTLFGGYLSSPGYRAYLEQIFNSAEPNLLKAQCPSLRLLESNKFIMVEEPKFVRSGTNYHVESGAWVGVAVLDRCGAPVTRRALLRVAPDTHVLQPTPLLPGEFRGNLKLEADAMRIVLPAMMAIAKCSDLAKARVLDVKSHGPPTPQGWSETWTAAACNMTIEADVSYSPIPGGMNISAGHLRVR